MDVDEARVVLGIGRADEWGAVHRAYRRLIRAGHPDRAGPAANARAARLNEAYAVLSRAHRSVATTRAESRPARTAPRSRRPAPAPSPARRTSNPRGVHVGDPLDGAETLLLPVSPDDAFVRLLEAAHEVGEISYVDRSCAIFEVIVPHGGETCSLLITIEPHSFGTAAYCALESLERVASPSARSIVHKLAAALGET